MGDFLEEEGGVLRASGHFLPQARDEHGKALGIGASFFDEIAKAVYGEQADVLGEHGEKAALQETGDDLGIVAFAFEGLGELGEAGGDIARDLGGFLRGIERMRIGEDQLQACADFWSSEIGDEDAVALRIGKAFVASLRCR